MDTKDGRFPIKEGYTKGNTNPAPTTPKPTTAPPSQTSQNKPQTGSDGGTSQPSPSSQGSSQC